MLLHRLAGRCARNQTVNSVTQCAILFAKTLSIEDCCQHARPTLLCFGSRSTLISFAIINMGSAIEYCHRNLSTIVRRVNCGYTVCDTNIGILLLTAQKETALNASKSVLVCDVG